MIGPEEAARWRAMGERWVRKERGMATGITNVEWTCPVCGTWNRMPSWFDDGCAYCGEPTPRSAPRDTPEAAVRPAKRPEEVVPLTPEERANTDRLLASVFGEGL